jgi:cell division protein FtsW
MSDERTRRRTPGRPERPPPRSSGRVQPGGDRSSGAVVVPLIPRGRPGGAGAGGTRPAPMSGPSGPSGSPSATSPDATTASGRTTRPIAGRLGRLSRLGPGRARGEAGSEHSGRRLRRGWARASGRPTPTFLGLLGIVVTLNLIGLVMVLSASSVTAQAEYGTPWYYVQRQAIWAALGAVVLLGVQRVDYRRWRVLAAPGLLVAVGLLALVMVPGVGVGANGATRWLGRGPIGIQPSELAKLALLLFVADLLGRRLHRMHDTRSTLRPVLLVTAVVAALIMAQPNLGTTIVLVAIVIALLFVAGAPWSRLVLLGTLGTTLATAAAFAVPYRRARMFAFLDPWSDPMNTGYQTIQAWSALAEGGVSGVGVGAGRAKWGFLPFAHTDFIFAVIGEEFGLVGASVVIGLFVLLGVLGVRTAVRAPDPFGMLLAAGVTTWFVAQAFVNIGAVVGVLPVTGVPLPFVSAGGSSLLASMAAAGILLNVARQASEGRPRLA